MPYFLLPLLFSLGWPGSVQGPQEYIELLKQAQAANQSRYPSGELRFLSSKRQVGQLSFFDRSRVHLVWQHDKVWAEVERWLHHTHDVDMKSTPPTERVEYIVNGLNCVEYYPALQRAFVTAAVRGSLPEKLWASPAARWYSPWTLASAGLTWGKILSPTSLPGTDPAAVHYKVTDQAGSIVRVLRHEDKYGGDVDMSFSLPLDGNVVDYEIREPVSSYTGKGSCDWEKDSRGRLYLARSTYSEGRRLPGESISNVYKYEMLHFDPDFKPPARRFDMASLSFPEGVVVENQITGRRQRVGDRPVDSVEGRIKALIEIMRSRGFALGGN
ncbi:MAG: hypothetical protein ACP5XB_31930 [Isosphaeraceae bacterium]